MLIICLSYEVFDSNSTVWKVCKLLPRLSLTRQPRIRFSWAEVHPWPECIVVWVRVRAVRRAGVGYGTMLNAKSYAKGSSMLHSISVYINGIYLVYTSIYQVYTFELEYAIYILDIFHVYSFELEYTRYIPGIFLYNVIYQVYTKYIFVFDLVYARYILYIFFWNCHIPGICPVYTFWVYISSIYQVYTCII